MIELPLKFLVFVAALAGTKRVPFDLPEGESEIIGFCAEYSGLKWGLFIMTDFLEVIIVSCLAVTPFFGGWQVPWLGPEGSQVLLRWTYPRLATALWVGLR